MPGLANAYVAGASNLPFGDAARLRRHRPAPSTTRTSPSSTARSPGEQLTAVRAINPDVAIIHAQQADKQGNVQLWGLVGVQKEAVLAAKRAIVTVEEVVDELDAASRTRSCCRPG